MIDPNSFGEPLFELDGWAFYAEIDIPTRAGGMSYVIHLNCSTSNSKNFFMNTNTVTWMPDQDSNEDPVCRNCKTPIPDALQAIMQLYKWDCK